MTQLPKKLTQKIDARKQQNALRELSDETLLVDLSSNDYLGFAQLKSIFKNAHAYLSNSNNMYNGATGSRLLTGNHALYHTVETQLCTYHNSKAALIFNSGYAANTGLLSSVPQRGDLIFYDEYSHASIRDGIQMSHAKAYKFRHNDIEHLQQLLHNNQADTVYVITESVFSMDGDSPNLTALVTLCQDYHAHLIVDEAHAIGVYGNHGEGLVQQLNIENQIFARVITFGKALGCHGAAVLGSTQLKTYLINFARSVIYTTGLPPHALATIFMAYNELKTTNQLQKLHQNIAYFKSEITKQQLQNVFINSSSAIQSAVISGNSQVKTIAQQIQYKKFKVKPILSPTVPKGQERLRFCLHSFNTKTEIKTVLNHLKIYIKTLTI